MSDHRTGELSECCQAFPPAEEQDPRSDARGVRCRLKNLGNLQPLWRVRDAMRNAKPLSDASHTFKQLKAFLKKRTLSASISGALNRRSSPEREGARLISTENPSHKVGVFGGFTVGPPSHKVGSSTHLLCYRPPGRVRPRTGAYYVTVRVLAGLLSRLVGHR